jgi:AcrR family transcriptional regulator
MDGTTPTRSGVGRRRRTAIGDSPSTERGRRTRAQLLAAARTVFERDGYLDARVADIARLAGIAHGSFYTYFDSKAAIFRTLINDVMESGLYAPREPRPATGGTPSLAEAWARIEADNRRYLAVFTRDRALMGLFEQVASFDDELRAYRIELRERTAARAAAGLRRLQEWGLADRALDPDTASLALSAMVGNYVYYWLIMGIEAEEEHVVEQLTRLWARAIGLAEPS